MTDKSKIRKEYEGVGRIIRDYFRAYGGWGSLLRSVYLHLSIVITLILYPIWSVEGWWDTPASILPNVIGFSLGGYAILMGFGDESFRDALKGSTKERASPFLAVSATFVHFILVQILALLLCLIAKGRMLSKAPQPLDSLVNLALSPDGAIRHGFVSIAWALGFGTFIYAIVLTMAATFGVFRLSMWYDRSPKKNTDGTPPRLGN